MRGEFAVGREGVKTAYAIHPSPAKINPIMKREISLLARLLKEKDTPLLLNRV